MKSIRCFGEEASLSPVNPRSFPSSIAGRQIPRWPSLAPLFLGVAWSLAWFLAPTVSLAGDLRAGVARIDITPTQPVTLMGYSSRTNLSHGVHDPLSARALAFEQDGHRLVLVSTDILGFYYGTADAIGGAIRAACGLAMPELFLCAIHTHSAPTVVLDPAKGHAHNVAYSKILQAKLIEVAQTALQRLAPVQLSVGSGSSPVGVNRREVSQDNNGKSKIILGRNPSLLTDREVQILKLTRPGGKELAGVLFAYATHSTSLGPRNYIISGDIHGQAEQFLERYLGADVVAPGFAGASGDIDPWVRVLPDFRTNNGWVPETVLLGTMLGEEVARGLEANLTTVTNTTIQGAFKILEMPGKPRTDAADSTPRTELFNLTVARVGDIAFVGLGGEVFNGIGKAIKTASPFRRTFVFTHCNGAAGYVPTRPSYDEGGYEVQSSAFGPGGDERLIDEATQLLRRLWFLESARK
jgi:neutral ceramidase